jgi:hypothetical protein
LRDTVELERRGIPAVALVTQPFLGIARSQAAALGLQSARVVGIEHPLDGLDHAGVRARALTTLPQVVGKVLE